MRLVEATGGWPAPLRLLALLIQDHEPSAFVNSFAGAQRPVVEYLTTDVLELLEPDAQDFVLKVSILTRMCGSLCDAVVGHPGRVSCWPSSSERACSSRSTPPGAGTANITCSPRPCVWSWPETTLSCSPRFICRAAGWFEETGDLESAAEHAIASRDVALAGRLVAAQVESLAARGRWATVRGWLAELSWPAALADPELAWVRATSDAFGHDLDGAERWLDVASSGAPESMGSLGLPLGFRVEMLRALVGVNDVARGEEAAHRALEIAPGPMWQGAALAALGQAQYLRGATTEARDTLRTAVALISGRTSEPSGPRDRQLRARRVRRRRRRPCEPDAGSSGRDDGHPATDRHLRRPAHGARGARPSEGDPRGAVGWYESAIEIFGADKRSAWLANAYLLNAGAFHALGDTDR